MKKACYAFLLTLAFSQVASALPDPNFSGTWVLDQINGQAAIVGSRVSIIQKGNEFAIENGSPITKQEYVADGTERKLPKIGSPTSTYYTAKWEGNLLIIEKKTDITGPPDGRTWAVKEREVWSISTDGKSLTHSSVLSPDKTLTMVFKKADTQ
jgi:hypothetical protein